MTPAGSLHNAALVVDGLVYHGDGDVTALRAGDVDALNLTVCHFEADFEAARAAGRTGLVMGWQNGRPLADRPERLHFFRRLGLRIMQLTYNYQNFLGSGCLESEDGGLTSLGHDVVRLMNELGIAIDLSHVGERTAMDAIGASRRLVLVTHANVKAVTDLARNKSDDLIRAVADGGGFIGASVYGPMCWDGDTGRRPSIDDYLRHLEHIAEVAGITQVGFGTDLAVGRDLRRIAYERETPRRWVGIDRFNDAFGHDIPSRYLDGCNSHADLPKITEALLARGWTETQVKGYLGGNFRRVLGEIWG
jgi:membrane dipeptidase